MIAYLLSILLVEGLAQRKSREEKIITVKTFHDYSVDLENENDVLNINVPGNTFLFISSIDGYKASISGLADVTPDAFNRLIYFKNEGSAKITSTVNSLKFIFHTLPIDKLGVSEDKKNKFNYLYVSTYLDDKIIISDKFNQFNHYFSNFLTNNLIWLITDQNINCRIGGRYTYFTSIYDENNEDILYEVTGNDDKWYSVINGQSKIILLDSVYNHSIELLPEKDTVFDYYTKYKAIVNLPIQNTKIITRGADTARNAYVVGDLPNGISYLDFSITKTFEFNLYNNIVLFPYKTMNDFGDYNDEICGIYQKNSDQYFREKMRKTFLCKSNQLNEFDINLPVLCFKYIDSYVSMCPNEYIKIGSVFDESVNYSSSSDDFQYIMASFQDIETTVSFKGKVEIKCIFDNCTNKKYIESGDKIIGPFWAIVHKGSESEFRTILKGEFKEGLNNYFHKHIKSYHLNYYLSSKYGILDFYDAYPSNHLYHKIYTGHDATKINAYNFVYINQLGEWKGEIVDPSLPQKEREFGPYKNKRSFYINGVTKCSFVLYNIDYQRSQIFFITQQLESEDKYKCDKLVVFNHPSSIKIRSSEEKDSIHLDLEETLCIAANYIYPVCNYSFINLNNDDDNLDAILYGVRPNNYYYLKNTDFDKKGQIRHFLEGLFTIQSKNAAMGLDMIFDIENYDNYNTMSGVTNKEYSDLYQFYSELSIDSSSGIHYINNIYEEPSLEQPDHFDGDVFEIIESGYKYVDLSNKESFTILCPKNSLLYIHNIDDIEVTLYNEEDEIFGEINTSSLDRIINFALGGKAIITKTNSQNVELFFSFLNRLPESLYVCSDTDTNIKICSGDECNFSYTRNDYESYLWLTYHTNVNIQINKFLPIDHIISVKNPYQRYLENTFNNYQTNDIILRISDYSEKIEGLYTDVIVSPLEKTIKSGNSRYDVVNKIIETTPLFNCILITKNEEDYIIPGSATPKPKDDNLGIIVVVICCVGGALLIAGIITAVICVKKRKKKNEENLSENEASDI